MDLIIKSCESWHCHNKPVFGYTFRTTCGKVFVADPTNTGAYMMSGKRFSNIKECENYIKKEINND